jgi:hypothetical protein
MARTLQPHGAQSTTEAQYMAAAAVSKEALWHRKLRHDLRLPTKGPKLLWGGQPESTSISEGH